MHDARTIDSVLELAASGAGASEISRQLGVPRSTIRDWIKGSVPRQPHGEGWSGRGLHDFGALPPAYAYLLGLYLGDGWLTTPVGRVPKLRIALDQAYPGIVAEAMWAIERVRIRPAAATLRARNCVEVYSYWRHWPCLFPQHGRGKKHEREIRLASWQERLVDLWPWELLRGLIQSDGCRFINTGTNWRAPRYGFKQKSDDIRAIFCAACTRLGLRWTTAGDTIYVSRKADVAILDRFVGPKR